jgi:sugar phosphate isomerase/epimerase
MGKIDWQDAMQGLKAIGYQGLFNYEVASYRIPAPAGGDFARLLVETANVLLDVME